MSAREVYEAYLQSQHWFDLRDAAFNKVNRRCEVCACKARHGHHLLYRNPLTECTEDDIMALCARCHDLWHDWLKMMGKKLGSFCRKSTRGVILGLLNPMRAAPKTVVPKPHPTYFPPTAQAKSKRPSKSERRLRRMEKQEKKRQAKLLVVAKEPDMPPVLKNQKPKSEKRIIRESKYQFFLEKPEFVEAMNGLSRNAFKSFLHKWAMDKYESFGGWNSLLSTAVAMYDRTSPNGIKATRVYVPVPVTTEPVADCPF